MGAARFFFWRNKMAQPMGPDSPPILTALQRWVLLFIHSQSIETLNINTTSCSKHMALCVGNKKEIHHVLDGQLGLLTGYVISSRELTWQLADVIRSQIAKPSLPLLWMRLKKYELMSSLQRLIPQFRQLPKVQVLKHQRQSYVQSELLCLQFLVQDVNSLNFYYQMMLPYIKQIQSTNSDVERYMLMSVLPKSLKGCTVGTLLSGCK